MNTPRIVGAVALALLIPILPLRSMAQVSLDVDVTVGAPPPPIPVYEPPPVPGPDYEWMPGYWAWGPGGYYWVPGTWVQAPQPDLYWTPGYWSWNGSGYFWNAGYWAPQVGYYGDVDYGGGYFGVGYVGGRWAGPVFEYNTYVTNVDPVRVHNVYVDRNVFINRSTHRVSYVGHGGLDSHPDAAQLAVMHERHWGFTPAQREHVLVAAENRNFLATVNHGRPEVPAVRESFSQFRRPAHMAALTPVDRSHAQAHAAYAPHAAPQVQHHYAPQQQAAPHVQHYAPQQHAAPRPQRYAPQQHAAPQPQHAAPHAHSGGGAAPHGGGASHGDRGERGHEHR